MKMTFNKKLLLGFGISIALLIISSVASFISIENLLFSAERVNHTHEVITSLENVMSAIKDAETGQRGYMLTGDDKFLFPYKEAYPAATKMIERITGLTIDNPAQQKSIQELRLITDKRLFILQNLIDKKRTGRTIASDEFEKGRILMMQIREIIKTMEEREQKLLVQRTERLNKFASFTPLLLLIAGLLAVVITISFYLRIRNDFAQRMRLQKELEAKDADITRRINIIQGIANRISEGNYTIRAKDEGTDGLGNLSFALNRMAESLEYSFNLLSDKEWLQTGIAKLNESILGEKKLKELTRNVLNFVTEYTGSIGGAVYLAEDDYLFLSNSLALTSKKLPVNIPFGEGLAGQCAVSQKMEIITDIPAENIAIGITDGQIKPTTIIVFPVFQDNVLKAVIELGAIKKYSKNELEFFEQASHIIGTVINTAQNRKRLQELLEETQAQAEELQMQHNDLENMNSELEAQAVKLQTSEEELKVQQEELLQANQELEERSSLLEEKNKTITDSNIEIQKKAKELAISTKYKSEFLANMSHELRTPLNSILLLSRLLAENNSNNLNRDEVEYAHVIQSSGNGLLMLIDEILDLSKIESGKLELDYSIVSICQMGQSMNSIFKPMASEKNIDFNIEIDSETPATIQTDQMRLEQIIKNLLSNAIKFTAKGHVELRVSMADEYFIRFSVHDTGIGISHDKHQSIFEAFQQADGSTRRKYGGTGLGLSISKELVQLLGGEIHLVSEPGEGSEFTVYIPKDKPASSAEPFSLDYSSEEKSEQPEEEQTVKASSKYKTDIIPEAVPDDRNNLKPDDKVILIIEDDTAFAKSILEFTRSKNYKGIVAVRGDDGISFAQQYKPTAILLDLQLPVKDGWEVMEALKTNKQTKHIPVHVMSSYSAKKESLTKGAIDFINKPVAYEKMDEIFIRINDALNTQNKKVLIIEENNKHAKALAYFLEKYKVHAQINSTIDDSIYTLKQNEVRCVILDMGIPDENGYRALEEIKKNEGLEDLPIIIFTGKNLSAAEAQKIKQYADSIVLKTAHSYQRILDEVSLFLHLLEEDNKNSTGNNRKLGMLEEVLKNKKVLIADDDVRNIYSLTKILEHHKMKVAGAIDGKEALALLNQNPDTNVVLIDIMMPKMDGYEAIKHIRKMPQYKNLPIIAVTAKAMTGDRQKCIDAGASDYISKPVDSDQLLSLLRVWLYEKS